MAKKFVRGITDIKTISNQDFDTNNVNDLLSDGEHNYIHRKKGSVEEYHNLTDNIKTISSSNTDLIEVTNNNTTNNTATLNPKHDGYKEQVLESTSNTITVNRGGNGTSETTKVDTNPEKVLEHDNLIAGDNLTKSHSGDTTTLKVADNFTQRVTQAETDITALQNNKQNSLVSNTSVGVLPNNSLKQLFYYKKTYSVGSSYLKTHVKSLAQSTNITTSQDEYNLILRIAPNTPQVKFILNASDTNNLEKIVGLNRVTNINACQCVLNESTLTVTIDSPSNNYHIVSLTTIID